MTRTQKIRGMGKRILTKRFDICYKDLHFKLIVRNSPTFYISRFLFVTLGGFTWKIKDNIVIEHLIEVTFEKTGLKKTVSSTRRAFIIW